MDISTSSFCQAFGSKHELFERYLKTFRERQVRRMTAAQEQEPSGKEFRRYMLMAATGGHPEGYLIMNTATEFSSRDAVVADQVGDGARYVVSTISGMKTMANAGLPATAIEDVAKVASSALT